MQCRGPVQVLTEEAGRFRQANHYSTIHPTRPYTSYIQVTYSTVVPAPHTQTTKTHKSQVSSISSSRKYFIPDLQASVTKTREQQTSNKPSYMDTTTTTVTTT